MRRLRKEYTSARTVFRAPHWRRYNPGMCDGDRSAALTTACDDLQAQLEAGDRSLRHLDHDLLLLHESLQAAFVHAGKIGSLQLHMKELRANMREQRDALREVRRAARALCASLEHTRRNVASLATETAVSDHTAAALGEQTRLETPTHVVGHDDAEKSHAGQTGPDDARSRPLASRTTRLNPAT